jgi:hypothetical protein
MLVGGAVATSPLVWPRAAQLQPKMLRVGFVGMQPREAPLYASFLKRMPFGYYTERADTDHGLEQDFNSARPDEQEADCNHSAIMF